MGVCYPKNKNIKLIVPYSEQIFVFIKLPLEIKSMKIIVREPLKVSYFTDVCVEEETASKTTQVYLSF